MGCLVTPRTALALLAAMTIACSASETSKPSARVFSGEVQGTDVRVGVVASAQQARIFFCGGSASYQTKTKWLTANLDSAHQLALPNTVADPWKLEGEVSDAEVSGSIDMGDAVALPFRAPLVSEGTLGGLYEGTAPCGKLSLIVSQPSLAATPEGIGACIGMSGIEQVDPLMPIARGPDGTIAVSVGDVANPFAVHAATPPVD
jgi:hypothetical protein